MTVRLSDEATTYIDKLVRESTFDSRASYLTWLVGREAQRAEAWAEILRMRREDIPMNDPELDAIVKATSGRSLAHLDR